MLPPCSRNLEFHTRRSNYVAGLVFRGKLIDDATRFSFVAWIDCKWWARIDGCFLDDVCDLLLLLRLDDEIDFDEDIEENISDDDDYDGEEEELWWRTET